MVGLAYRTVGQVQRTNSLMSCLGCVTGLLGGGSRKREHRPYLVIGPLLGLASFLCHLTKNRQDASRRPRYHLSAFVAVMVHTTVSTPNTNEVCSMQFSVGQNTLRSSARSFHCPPGLAPSALITITIIIPLGTRPRYCRATVPVKKHRRLRIIVSMLSYRVVLRAFAP